MRIADTQGMLLGRKEIITVFYIYLALTICSLIIDAGVVPPKSGPFPYFVAVQSGLVSSLCACLLVNGFVGFQLYEDGTALSVWLIRISSVAMFAMTFVISLLTFKSWGGLGPENTIGLFVVLYLFNAICVAIYIVMQLLLVVNTLDDRWPIGHICFGLLVFIIGQVLLYEFSDVICNNVQHYLDGLFFATFCNLLAVMMVYKVSCGIPKFSVHMMLTWYSSGTPSPQKTWNSPSESSQTPGRSRSYCRRKSVVRPFTKTTIPNTRAACITTVTTVTTVPRITAITTTNRFCRFLHVHVTIDLTIFDLARLIHLLLVYIFNPHLHVTRCLHAHVVLSIHTLHMGEEGLGMKRSVTSDPVNKILFFNSSMY